MTQQVINFVRTTLRAPCGTTDSILQLVTGGASQFAPIEAGNWCYVTVNDSTTVEVMKYVSAGTPINDTIPVIRAQDNTTAKAFPAGSCVTIGWNVEQVTDLIAQQLLIDFDTIELPRNTIDGTDFAGIVGIPPPNKYYGVNTTTGSLWYWVGPGGSDWVYINSNSVLALTVDPTTSPHDNITWAINTTSNTLFWWSGLSWRAISGSGGGSYLEVFNRTYLPGGGGTAIGLGTDNGIGNLITGGMPVTTSCYYKSNPAVSSVLTVNGDNNYVVNANCIAEFTCSIVGDMPDLTHDLRAHLSLFHSHTTEEWAVQQWLGANSNSSLVAMVATTGPLQLTVNDEWAASIVCVDGGASYTGFTLTQMDWKAKVIALL